MNQDYIRQMEAYTFRARPALLTRYYDGWVLRFAEGYTRGANAISPIYGSSENVIEKIKTCEKLYQDYDLTPRFKMTDAASPENLESILIDRGYTKEGTTSVQVLKLARLTEQVSDPAEVIAVGAFSDEWLGHLVRLNAVDTHHLSTIRKIHQHIQPETCYAAIKQDDKIVAVGLGVYDNERVGLFNLVTEAAYRRRGFGRVLIMHLLHWGIAKGATHAYLQVEADNYPALSLYAHLGFHEVYQYWYRTGNNEP